MLSGFACIPTSFPNLINGSRISRRPRYHGQKLSD